MSNQVDVVAGTRTDKLAAYSESGAGGKHRFVLKIKFEWRADLQKGDRGTLVTCSD
jgi:hypothetical protein